jgi:predicted dinucleotide-binding enzyme
MTNITILGTGNMGRAIAIRMLAGGNTVTLLSRTPGEKAALIQELSAHVSKGGSVMVEKLGTPISNSMIISTIGYPAVLDVLRTYGSQLESKVLVDVSNPLNPTYDDLSIPGGTSAAEEIAKVAPKSTRVIKAYNTIFAAVLAQGQISGQPVDVFIAGDDDNAKATLSKLIADSGMHPVDAGPLRRARQLEHMALLIITMQSKQSKAWMNTFKLID